METRGERWHREAERHLVRDAVAAGVALALSIGAITAAGAIRCYADETGDYGYLESRQTINAYDGIYWYGDRLETYYSSEVAYHWRTPEWWVDDQGFYRTDEGYYVVAANEYEFEEGSVIETSMGAAQVLDCGCDWGVTDFYVNW